MSLPALSLQDHIACVATVQRFSVLVDAGRYDEAAALFAAQGVLRRPDEQINGREALRSSFEARPSHRLTRHIVTNVLVEPDGEGRAKAFSYVSVYRHLGTAGSDVRLPVAARAPETVAEYHDELAWHDGGWQIAHRTVKPVFDTSGVAAASARA